MSYLSFLSSSFADSAGESLVVEDVVAVLVLVELEVPRRVRCEVRSGLRAFSPGRNRITHSAIAKA